MQNPGEMKEPVRILLLEIPLMLRDMFEHAIESRGDCEVWKETWHPLQPRTERMAPPDVVILGLTAAEDSMLVPALLGRWPRAQVMTMAPPGEDATVYELSPRRRDLGPMSPAEIVDALNRAVRLTRSHEVPRD